MPSRAVLVIDDEPQIRRVVRNALSDAETRVIEAATGREGIDIAAAERPAIIVLDLGLPDMDGKTVCKEIRQWLFSPIVILSARHSDEEKVALLDAGADDYMTKPFSTTEFKARIRAHLRRGSALLPSDSDIRLDVGELSIDFVKPAVSRAGTAIRLTKTEWDLLRALVRHSGRTLTHSQLFREVWGNSFRDAQQNLRVHIRSLRRKIEADPMRPKLIVTEPGVGYRFDRP